MLSTSATTRLPQLLRNGIEAYMTIHPSPNWNELSILYVDIVEFSRFEQKYGYPACDHVLRILETTIANLLKQNLLAWKNLHGFHVWDDAFAIIIPHSKTNQNWYSRWIHHFVSQVEDEMNQEIAKYGYTALHLRYGLAHSSFYHQGHNTCHKPTEWFYHLLTIARRHARRNQDSVPLFFIEELQRIIQEKQITSYYQPIIQLQSGLKIGWESLARGPRGSELEHPTELFGCAEKTGYLLDLERICRHEAIQQAHLHSDMKLFINLSPHIFSDPSFREGETLKIIQNVGIRPEQIVFEVTEHQAIDDYDVFLKLMDHYRKQGYQIAIDDVGSGYSGLVTLMQVKPDYVKIDMELIRNIHKDTIKQDIVRAIQQISSGFSSGVIAEGIETEEELHCVKQAGIAYGQGYLFATPKPSHLIPELS